MTTDQKTTCDCAYGSYPVNYVCTTCDEGYYCSLNGRIRAYNLTFLVTKTMTFQTDTKARVLLVAGGGAGGSSPAQMTSEGGGGGGGGGVGYGNITFLAGVSYTFVVGSGGSGSTNSNGDDSIISGGDIFEIGSINDTSNTT